MNILSKNILLKFVIVSSYVYIFIFEVNGQQKINIGNCLEGDSCKNCPTERTRVRLADGRSICCTECQSSPMISNKTGSCICVNENQSGRQSGRIIFSGHDKQHYPPQNQDNTFGRPQRKFSVESLGKAISLMADAMEKLDLRLRRVEETLGQVNLLKFGDIPISDHVEESLLGNSMKCKQNYVEVGSFCIFISVFTNHRANWKDAHKECTSKGATLAEVLTHTQYLALSSYLSATSTTAGYSYWLGGLYPGGIWIWLSNGQKVTLNANYWTTVRSVRKAAREEAPIVPGDTKNGRCLGLHYVMENSAYKIAADECGYEKFFICQMEKSS